MGKESNPTFLVLLVGMALAGAALIWSLPPLLRPAKPRDSDQVWTTAILGGLFVAFSAGTLWLRPAKPRAVDQDGA